MCVCVCVCVCVHVFVYGLLARTLIGLYCASHIRRVTMEHHMAYIACQRGELLSFNDFFKTVYEW